MKGNEMTGTLARKSGFTFAKGIVLGAIVIGLIIVVGTLRGLVETVDAGEIVVKQGFLSGDLTFWKDPGPKGLWWGKATHYKKSSQFWFSSSKDQGNSVSDQSLKMRFNDGGHANLSGGVRYTLPMDDESLKLLHTTFGSQEVIDQSLIRTVLEKSVYLSGQLMSSTQSYAERRSELLFFIEDQAVHGVYQSSSHCEKQPDAVTKQERTVCLTELAKDAEGHIKRVEKSPLESYHINLSGLSINELKYDEAVTKQINDQQAAFAAVQTSAAKARQAEQNAITAAKNGEADAATAKWKQEVIKAQAVTEAQQKMEVSKLARDAAEYSKQEQTLLGEGEAARKKAVMLADGALEKKLGAWVEVNKAYAGALGQQRLVPEVVMGGGTMPNSSNLVELLTASTARQLALSMQVPGAAPKK
jgi:SPFH domain / Band 7 family.